MSIELNYVNENYVNVYEFTSIESQMCIFRNTRQGLWSNLSIFVGNKHTSTAYRGTNQENGWS